MKGIDMIELLTAAAINCLTLNAYHEARGEGVEGVHAVTHVVMNRVESWRWPETPCAVIYDDEEFSWTFQDPADPDPEVFLDVQEMVIDALFLPDSTGGATHYHADYVEPFWASLYPVTASVGRHIFYKAPKGL
jgi:spore germination cell wall hydrolase CwlJ-like protein